jgi:hypothetical protein
MRGMARGKRMERSDEVGKKGEIGIGVKKNG